VGRFHLRLPLTLTLPAKRGEGTALRLRPRGLSSSKDGWYQLPNREGVVVTKELVDRLIKEADAEEARRKGGY